MKWYGLFNNSLNQIIYKKKSLNKKTKRHCFKSISKINLISYKAILYIPYTWDTLIFKNNNKSLLCIYIYSKYYFFYVPLINNFLKLKYDYGVKSLSVQFLFNNNYLKLFLNHFKEMFYSFSKIFFKKLKFKGKGYYIFKNYRNTIALQLGYSHLIYIYSFFINVKFLSKTTIFMFGLNHRDVLNRSNAFFNLRQINVFTGKGIRFSRQLLYKKTGKISSYR